MDRRRSPVYTSSVAFPVEKRDIRREKKGEQSLPGPLDCSMEFRMEDPLTGIQFRDCRGDYTRCTNAKCIKKLV